MKKPIPLIKETIKSLKKRLKETKNAQHKLKLKTLVLLKKGKMNTRQEVSKELSVHYNTIGIWLNLYETGGLKSLLEIKPVGAPKGQVSLPQEVIEDLKEQLNDSQGFSGYNAIKDWLKEKYNIDIKYKTLYRIVRYELKAKAKVPRKSNEKKNEKDVENFKNQLSNQLQDIIKQQHTSDFGEIRIFVSDESRFGLMPVTKRRITAKGVKPIQRCKMSFQNYYLYGSIEPITGENFFFEFPKLNTDCFQIFLNEFSKNYSNSLNIIMLDNGSFHKAKKLVIPCNTVLLFFPPFSPELNPIERFWQDVKKQIACMTFPKLEDLANYVASVIKKYSLEAIASLTGFQYILDAFYSLSL